MSSCIIKDLAANDAFEDEGVSGLWGECGIDGTYGNCAPTQHAIEMSPRSSENAEVSTMGDGT